MGDIGGALIVLAGIFAFMLMALLAGAGMALWSIWLPITLWQAVLVMIVYGLFGAFLAVRSIQR